VTVPATCLSINQPAQQAHRHHSGDLSAVWRTVARCARRRCTSSPRRWTWTLAI
jgi:hypothetical protein